MKRDWASVAVLVSMLVAFIVPTLWLCNKISADEYAAIAPPAIIGGITILFKLWSSGNSPTKNDE